MQKVILHIGPPKTGSTSIQIFLNSAQEELLSNGILYPAEGRLKAGIVYRVCRPQGIVMMQGPSNSHRLLVWSLKKQVDGIDADHCWSDVVSEIHSVKSNTVILSDEEFASLSEEQIVQLRRYLANFTVTVVVYLRNLLDWMLSVYTQDVKMGRYHRSFRNFIQTEMYRFNFEGMIKRWSDVFGQKFICIKLFDNIKRNPGLERDLISVLELNPDKFERHLSKVSKRNVSPPDDVVNMIRFLNLIDHHLGSQRRFEDYFYRARKKILGQCPIARMLIAAGRPFFSKPLYSNEEIVLLRDITKEKRLRF